MVVSIGEGVAVSSDITVLGPQDLSKPLINVKAQIISHFTKEEMIDRLSVLPPDKTGMLFQFLWRTGVRVTEAISLSMKDLDFANNEIMIRWLKNRKAQYRVIPMHSSLKNPLYLFTASLLAENKIFPITRQRVDQLCKRYGFDHAHKIRHSFAINFLRQSDTPMALIELRDILGHKNIQTTIAYLRVVPMDTKAALGRVSFD